jgi:acyl-CoA synthetase (AMP-forming)/AMP-acid ligase II
MLAAAVMRANMVPFCLSPRNTAAGVANLLQQANPVAVYISPDLKNVMIEALSTCGMPLPVLAAPTFEQLQGDLDSESSAEPLPVLQNPSMDNTAYILHSSGGKYFLLGQV